MDFSDRGWNPIFLDIVKFHCDQIEYVMDNIQKINEKQVHYLRIASSIYFMFSNYNNGTFVMKGSQLKQEDAIMKIKGRMTNHIYSLRKRRKKVLNGIAFNDFVEIEKNKKKMPALLPLHVPDILFDNSQKPPIKRKKIVHDHKTNIDDYIKKATTVDKAKFKIGCTHYVNGYCYSSPADDPKELYIVDYNEMGKTDLVFKIAGTEASTSVKIRKIPSSHALLNNVDIVKKMKHKKINLGGNARREHKSWMIDEHFMFTMMHNDQKIASVPIRKWNEMDPKSLSAEMFAKTLESAISKEFKETLEKIKELEKEEKVNHLGKYGHSIDISVNLVNEPHFDMGDTGYGVGVWLSSDGKSNPHWYFILPNASIAGSKGVAIKLDHGIMIEWNGTEIKHCSSDPGFNKDQTLFGLFMGPKRRFKPSLIGTPKKAPLIPKFDAFVDDLKIAFKNNK